VSDNVTFINEPYTCTVCGRKNLKYTEISYKENENGQIDESTITCLPCLFKSPAFMKLVKPKHANDLDKTADHLDHNYNRRVIRRALKKKTQG